MSSKANLVILRFFKGLTSDVLQSYLINFLHKIANVKTFMLLFQIEVLNKHLFITAKPMIYLVNLSEKDFIRKKNKW